MKISAFIFAFLIVESLCITRKLRLKAQTAQEKDLASYAKAILNEINEYRSSHNYEPQIKANTKLNTQAGLEAAEIKKSNDFGADSRFQKLQKDIDDANILTQFIVKIDIKNGMPNQQALAIMVVEAILQDYQYNFMQKYTDLGIGIVNTDTNQCLIVLQLIKKLGTYKSCKEAKVKGDLSDQIYIKRNGKKEVLTCDQINEDGGWSLILDLNRITKAEPVYIAVDDRDLTYSELLFRAKDGFHLSYDHLKPNIWEMDGLILQFFYFRFGGKFNQLINQFQKDIWYSEANCNKGPRYQNPQTYDKNNDVKIIRTATKCFWAGSNQPVKCAKEFIIKKLPKGKLTQISELHTLEQEYIDCNYFDLFFDLYVR